MPAIPLTVLVYECAPSSFIAMEPVAEAPAWFFTPIPMVMGVTVDHDPQSRGPAPPSEGVPTLQVQQRRHERKHPPACPAPGPPDQTGSRSSPPLARVRFAQHRGTHL